MANFNFDLPPGGRTWTDTSLGFPADLGASWVHGASAQNPLTAVVQQLNLRTEDHPDEQRCRRWGLQLASGEISSRATNDRNP